MSPVEKLITQINKSSSNILSELDSSDPSFDVIIKELNQREKFVAELGDFSDEYPASSFAEDELTSIKSQFNAFNTLNKNIQSKAENLLNLQQQKLASAKKTRKAEDHYNISRNPDISYY